MDLRISQMLVFFRKCPVHVLYYLVLLPVVAPHTGLECVLQQLQSDARGDLLNWLHLCRNCFWNDRSFGDCFDLIQKASSVMIFLRSEDKKSWGLTLQLMAGVTLQTFTTVEHFWSLHNLRESLFEIGMHQTCIFLLPIPILGCLSIYRHPIPEDFLWKVAVNYIFVVYVENSVIPLKLRCSPGVFIDAFKLENIQMRFMMWDWIPQV